MPEPTYHWRVTWVPCAPAEPEESIEVIGTRDAAVAVAEEGPPTEYEYAGAIIERRGPANPATPSRRGPQPTPETRP